MITSEDLNAFSVVAKHLNISRAAREMGRSQSAVSRQILKLESLIDERLFVRTKRDLVLTDTGRQLLRDSRDVLTPLEKINATYFFDSLHGRKTLAAGMTPSIGMDFTGILIGTFEKYYPKLDVTIHLDFSRQLLEDLAHARLDMAFTVLPDNVPPHLITLFAYRERFHVVGRKIPKDLNKARWVLIEKGAHSRWLIDHYFRERLSNYRIHFEINSFHNIIPYLSHSDDLTVLPNSMMGQIDGLEHHPMRLYRNCGILVNSPALATWMGEVMEDFRQAFLARYPAAAKADIILESSERFPTPTP